MTRRNNSVARPLSELSSGCPSRLKMDIQASYGPVTRLRGCTEELDQGKGHYIPHHPGISVLNSRSET
jgi:hypothetical protein